METRMVPSTSIGNAWHGLRSSNITVPAGDVHGLPVGISFFGPAWSEPKLLACAYAFEQETQHRKKPRFLESLG